MPPKGRLPQSPFPGALRRSLRPLYCCGAEVLGDRRSIVNSRREIPHGGPKTKDVWVLAGSQQQRAHHLTSLALPAQLEREHEPPYPL